MTDAVDVLNSTEKPSIEFLSAREKFDLIPAQKRAEMIRAMSDEDAAKLQFDWEFLGRPKQLAPDHKKSKATSYCMCAYLRAQSETDKKLKIESFPGCHRHEVGDQTSTESLSKITLKITYEPPSEDGWKPVRYLKPDVWIRDVSNPNDDVCEFRKQWATWVLLAGRGFGKTRVGAEWIREMIETSQSKRAAVISPTASDARDVAVEGQSGLVNVCPPWNRPLYESTKRRVTWSNGAQASLFSAEEPERLRGPQFDAAWVDEIAGFDVNTQQMTWDMLQFTLRLGNNPRCVVTTTPKPTPLIQQLVKLARHPINKTIITTGSTYENRVNLAAPFMRQITQYEGTNLGRQEIYAELIDIEESGILKRSWFKRWPNNKAMPFFEYVIQSYDTAFTEKTENDPTGCLVLGIFRPDQDSPHCAMILDCWTEHLKYPELRKKATDDYKNTYGDQEAPVDILLIEDKGSGIPLIQDLQRAGLPVRKYNPGRPDKVMRLHAVSHLVYNGRVYIPESKQVPGEFVTWSEDFLREVCSFPNSAHDEYCFVAGTKVLMSDLSEKNIEDVVVGDKVWTRFGDQVVEVSSPTGENEIYEILFENGSSLQGTANHPILTESGYKPLASLNKGEYCVNVFTQRGSKCQENTLRGLILKNVNLTEKPTTFTKMLNIGEEVTLHCIETFGNFITELFQKVCKFITKMKTHSTMTFQTWNSSILKVIQKYILTTGLQPLPNGIVLKKEEIGIKSMLLSHSQNLGNNLTTCQNENRQSNNVKFAEKTIQQRNPTQPDSVHLNVKLLNLLLEENLLLTVLSKLINLVKCAGNYLSRQSTQIVSVVETVIKISTGNIKRHLKPVHGVVTFSKRHVPVSNFAVENTLIKQNSIVKILSVSRLNITKNTYNLQVKNSHEYVANGIVVHNCDTLSQGLALLRDQGWISIDPNREPDEEEDEVWGEEHVNPYCV